VPSAVFLSADLVGLAQSVADGRSRFEFQAKVDADQFFLAFDFGFHKTRLENDDFVYNSKGSFFRIGPQVNFMPYNRHRSSIYFGISYARASFDDDINYFIPGVKWNDTNGSLSNDRVNSRWFEMNLGIMVNISGPLHMGYITRFQFAQSLSGFGKLLPFEVPGFGSADKSSNFTFNYYLTYKLNFRNKPTPKRPIKVKEPNSPPATDGS